MSKWTKSPRYPHTGGRGDARSMISQRHRTVATTLVHELSGHSTSSHLNAASRFGPILQPTLRNIEEVEPGAFRTGWEYEAAARMEWQHLERDLMPTLTFSERALLRSQSWPAGEMSLSAVPSSPQTRIEGEGPGKTGLRSVSATSDIPVSVNDGRRLEVPANGLPLFGGEQLAVDTTLVPSLHCDGSPRRGAVDENGAVLVAVWRRKERTHPVLVLPSRRTRLVVLAGEVAGRWSKVTVSFIHQTFWQKPGHRKNPPS